MRMWTSPWSFIPSRSTAFTLAQRHNCHNSSSALMRSTRVCSLGLWRAGTANADGMEATAPVASVGSAVRSGDWFMGHHPQAFGDNDAIGGGEVGRQRDVMHVAQPQQGLNIWLVWMLVQGIDQKDHRVHRSLDLMSCP